VKLYGTVRVCTGLRNCTGLYGTVRVCTGLRNCTGLYLYTYGRTVPYSFPPFPLWNPYPPLPVERAGQGESSV